LSNRNGKITFGHLAGLTKDQIRLVVIEPDSGFTINDGCHCGHGSGGSHRSGTAL
jgi:hypothetical protein